MSVITPKLEAQIDAIVREVSQQEILPRFGSMDPSRISEKSSAVDLVALADQAAERALVAKRSALLPEADVFGEETVAEDPTRLDGVGQSEMTVIIDPIDGTWNFAKGIAVFGTMVAVIVGDETCFGLIHDPISGESILAHRGGGAWCVAEDGSRRQIHVAEDIDGVQTVGLVGSDWMRHPRFAMLAPPFARVSSLGASAHDYRMICMGRYHASICHGLNAWDHAAGQLIHAEAGGVSSLSDGQPYRPKLREGRLVLAHTPALLEELIAIVRSADAG